MSNSLIPIHAGQFGIQTDSCTIFTYEDGSLLRALSLDGKPIFIAKDACNILGLQNSSKALASIPDNQKGITPWNTLGGLQQVLYVTEEGLYALIFKSRKEEAVRLQNFVFEKVIPSIRKHGAYVAPNATMQGVAAAAQSSGNLEVAANLINLLYTNIPSLGEVAKQAIAGAVLGSVGIDIPRPVVKETWQMTEIAEPFGIHPNTAGKYCAHLKIEPDHGDTTYTTSTGGGKLVPQFRWNAAGKAACEAVLRTKPKSKSKED